MTTQQAIADLNKSDRGRNALRRMLVWLDDDGLGLDGVNQDAIVFLLREAWRRPGSTRDLMRAALTGQWKSVLDDRVRPEHAD
jgi:hypothetical protein